jgi:hypothetical protein
MATKPTRAEASWAGALRMAEKMIGETTDGNRSDPLYSAGCFIGQFAEWPEASGSWEADLVELAIIHGADDSERKPGGHLRRGIADGRRKPKSRPESPARASEGVPESLDEFVARKGLTLFTLLAFGAYEERGSLRWSVPGVPVRRFRTLARPHRIGWEAKLGEHRDLPLPYGFEQLRGNPPAPVYVVNGESSVWACYTAGIDAVTSCLGEKAPTGQQCEALVRLGRPLRVVYDLDDAGVRGSRAALDKLRACGAADVQALELPAALGEKGDVNDLWVQCAGDKARFAAALAGLQVRSAAVPKAPDKPADRPTAPTATSRDDDDRDDGDKPDDRRPEQPFELSRIDELRHAKLPPGLRRPASYTIDGGGVWERDEKDNLVRVTHAPLVMTGRSRDMRTGAEYRTITFRASGAPRSPWREIEVPRGQLLESRLLIKLTDYGLPIHSGQSGDCAKYLAYSEEALQAANVPEAVLTDTIGWQPDGSFLRGVHPHGATDCPRYRAGAESGEGDTMVQRIKTGGSREVFYSELFPAVDSLPVIRYMIAGLTSTLLLGPLDLESFVVDIAGMTSGGKTTALRLSVAMVGEPRLMKPWESTPSAHERIRCAMMDHPVWLDDSRQVTDPNLCTSVAYAVVNGQSKGRATPLGMQPGRVTRAVLISTGERPLSTMGPAGGLKARCLTVTADPMGERTSETSALCARLSGLAREHFGWLWADMVAHLSTFSAMDWEKVRSRMHAILQRLTDRAAELGLSSLVMTRQLQSLAQVQTAGNLIDAMLGRPSQAYVTDDILRSVLTSGATADQPTLALRDLLSWVAMNPARVLRVGEGGEAVTSGAPAQGYIAHHNRKSGAETVLRAEAMNYLTRAGYNAEEVVMGWKGRGWLHEGGDYKVTLVYPRTGQEPARTRTVRGFRFHDAARLAVGDVATESPRLVADEADPFDAPDRADKRNPFGRR